MLIKMSQQIMDKQDRPLLLQSLLQAGFPSPGEDLEGSPIDTNKLLVRNPAATFFMKVGGSSMKDMGIFEGDIVVIDRSLEPKNGSVVVAVINGTYTLKKIELMESKAPKLIPANKNFEPIEISKDDEFSVWGVVSSIIRKLT